MVVVLAAAGCALDSGDGAGDDPVSAARVVPAHGDSPGAGCHAHDFAPDAYHMPMPGGEACTAEEAAAADNSTISSEELMPPERGVMPRLPLAVTEDGEVADAHSPPETPR